MKINLVIPIALLLLIVSCNPAQQEDQEARDADKKEEAHAEHSMAEEPSGPLWKYHYNEQTEEFEIMQLRSVDKDTLTGEILEKINNTTWPRVQIKFEGISRDTAFISIPESAVLTQQMGTAGAEGFMISTTYSFTELKGIDHVSFDFEEGDHGIPGVYNRKSWDKNKQKMN